MRYDLPDESPCYIRLSATISESDGVFTVRVELSDSDYGNVVCGEQTAESLEIASALIVAVADRFSIAPEDIEIEVDVHADMGAARTLN